MKGWLKHNNIELGEWRRRNTVQRVQTYACSSEYKRMHVVASTVQRVQTYACSSEYKRVTHDATSTGRINTYEYKYTVQRVQAERVYCAENSRRTRVLRRKLRVRPPMISSPPPTLETFTRNSRP
jgi:hypothetical protein